MAQRPPVLGNVESSQCSRHYRYDPFGNTIRLTGTMARENPFRFSTKRSDDNTDAGPLRVPALLAQPGPVAIARSDC
jgi:hypothetical protein